MSETKVFHVTDREAGATIVGALKQWITGLSWNEAKKLVSSRRIGVNGAPCLDDARRLKNGEVVHLYASARTPPPTADDIQILYLDNYVAVVVKPALMTTLRHAEEKQWNAKRKNLQPTLDELLPRVILWARRPDARRLGLKGREARQLSKSSRQPLPKVRAVHRLDRDTSGVMVFALQPAAETHLIRQFKKHSIERVYRAIVHGKPESRTIESYLVRDRGDGLRGSGAKSDEAERAITHVKTLETFDCGEKGEYSLVECRLETGRTHQIRIHLSEAGHLLCGDPTYHKQPDGKSLTDRSGAPRLALHAYKLAFDHPITGKRMTFESPYPKDLEKFLQKLRGEQKKPTP
jgi:23S rRNA pseudouridine1911/1915/1917 synthase